MALVTGSINDRGIKGIEYQDKRINFKGASWIDPTSGSIALMEDFVGPLLTGGLASIAQSGTALTAAALSATAGPLPVGHGGWVAGKTDDVDGEIDEVALGGVLWMNPSRAGHGMMVSEFGFVIPTALTARMYFAGFGTALSTAAADGTLSIVTGTTLVDGSGSGDGAGFVFSSLATDADGFYMGAVKATVVGTAALCVAADASSLETVAVDNYIKLRVEADSAGNVYFYGIEDTATTAINRSAILKRTGTQATAITANELYVPIFSAATTTTTGVEWELDYIFGAVAA